MKTKSTEAGTFEAWMKQVNDILSARFMGINSNDLVDWGWGDAYESGATPQEAINDYFEENHDEFDLFVDDDFDHAE